MLYIIIYIDMIYNLEKISKIRRPEMEVVLIFAILKKNVIQFSLNYVGILLIELIFNLTFSKALSMLLAFHIISIYY